MVTLTLGTAGPPKRQFIELAFGDIGSAGYEFGRTPEEVSDALLRLNALMREYPFSSLTTYNQPSYGVGLPDELSGIPDKWLNVVALSLAERITPIMGATLAPEAKKRLSVGMALLNASAAAIPTMPYSRGTPSGAGNRTGLGPFMPVPDVDETDPSDPGNLAALI